MIRPLGDKVVVEAVEEEAKTSGGIFLPDTAKQKPQEGKVVAIGTGRVLEDGSRAKMQVKVGDRVVYSKYGGNEITVEGKKAGVLLCLGITGDEYECVRKQGPDVLIEKLKRANTYPFTDLGRTSVPCEPDA